MEEILSIIPGVSDILKVPVIMLATAASVSLLAIAARLLIRPLTKAFRENRQKEGEENA